MLIYGLFIMAGCMLVGTMLGDVLVVSHAETQG